MEGLHEIIKRNFFSLNAHIMLIDNEAKDSIPRLRTGSESVTFGPLGVGVGIAPDIKVEVVVLEGEGEPDHKLCVTGQILVGNQGLLLGNELAADTVEIPWPPGSTLVTVYTDGISFNTTKVYFFLEYLGEQ